ncbi:MAG: hypothetical protein K0R43_1406, partial [Pseudoduganella sp.]|nr:hypothetical protein [Pseudoduganella sp.]
MPSAVSYFLDFPDDVQDVSKTLVIDNCRLVGDRELIGGGVGEGGAIRADLNAGVRILIDLDLAPNVRTG